MIRATGYTVAAVLQWILILVAPADSAGNPTGTAGNVLIDLAFVIGVPLAIATVIDGAHLRRAVWPDLAIPRAPALQYELPSAVSDPAVAAALAARARRDEARQLTTRDQRLARVLGIGRPDLNLGYDDGGLVELNSAPVTVIRQVLGVTDNIAQQIVATREQLTGTPASTTRSSTPPATEPSKTRSASTASFSRGSS